MSVNVICSLIIVTSFVNGYPTIKAQQVHGVLINPNMGLDKWKVNFTNGFKAAKVDLFLNEPVQLVQDNMCSIVEPSSTNLVIP